MIVSHQYKFIYIGVPKTATNSIINAISKIKGDITYNFCQPPHRHAGVETASRLLPEARDYFKFAFCRNPWDWLVSFYTWSKVMKKIDHDMTLSEYITRAEKEKQSNFKKKVSQVDHIENVKRLDMLGRFENLQQDFNMICDRLSLPIQKLPVINKTEHSDYRSYYDDKAKERVEALYREDIETFGYDF